MQAGDGTDGLRVGSRERYEGDWKGRVHLSWRRGRATGMEPPPRKRRTLSGVTGTDCRQSSGWCGALRTWQPLLAKVGRWGFADGNLSITLPVGTLRAMRRHCSLQLQTPSSKTAKPTRFHPLHLFFSTNHQGIEINSLDIINSTAKIRLIQIIGKASVSTFPSPFSLPLKHQIVFRLPVNLHPVLILDAQVLLLPLPSLLVLAMLVQLSDPHVVVRVPV